MISTDKDNNTNMTFSILHRLELTVILVTCWEQVEYFQTWYMKATAESQLFSLSFFPHVSRIHKYHNIDSRKSDL